MAEQRSALCEFDISCTPAHRANRSRVQAAHSAAAPAAAASSMGAAVPVAAAAASGAWPRAALQSKPLADLVVMRCGRCRAAAAMRQVHRQRGLELGRALQPPRRRAWRFMRSWGAAGRWRRPRAFIRHRRPVMPLRPSAAGQAACSCRLHAIVPVVFHTSVTSLRLRPGSCAFGGNGPTGNSRQPVAITAFRRQDGIAACATATAGLVVWLA